MLTDKMSEYMDWGVNLFTANKTSLGLQDIYRSDQNLIPRTPTLCVEPGVKRRELIGAPRKTQSLSELIFLFYVSKLQDNQINQDEVVALAESAEDLLHLDAQMSGLAIHSMVTEVEYGYAVRRSGQFRAVRLVFEIMSQQFLPQSV
jgi:hypothetical protein